MFKFSSSLVLALVGFVACTPNTSTVGQRITCETDPDSGTILSCQPSDDEDDDDPNTCEDIDEDGDGMPDDDGGGGDGGDDDGDVLTLTSPTEGDGEDDDHDEDGDGTCDGEDEDDDDDGIGDDDDCDEEEGGDGDESELPYDVRMQLGDSYTPIADAFAEKGAQPAQILSVTFDGSGSWRAAELAAGTAFTITSADCSHAGNRDIGRDRVIVTWRNADGTTEADHLDLRYCE